jgi:hypothetical protein
MTEQIIARTEKASYTNVQMTYRSESGAMAVCDETQLDYILQCRFEVEVTMNFASRDESTIGSTVHG